MSRDIAYKGISAGAEFLTLAIDACPAGMIVTNSDGVILLVNGEIERLFGYGRDKLLGRSADMLLPERLHHKQSLQCPALALDPKTRGLGHGDDFIGRRQDGSEFSFEIGVNPIYVDGEMLMVAAIIDADKRKRDERIHDELMATVSHELRTPMTSIAASLGLLLAGSATGLQQPAAHLLEIAHANCQRMIRMVNDILDLKKLGSGRMTFRFQKCDAHALLQEAIEASRGSAVSCGVELTLESAAAPIALHVDPGRFHQVVINLLSNAIKFSPSGEDVIVTVEKREETVRIAVRDHDPGIPAEFRPRVFEAFAQADSVPGRKTVGSGLGLSIARKFITAMHGEIGLDDAPGGGTVFYIDLPVVAAAARREEKTSHAYETLDHSQNTAAG